LRIACKRRGADFGELLAGGAVPMLWRRATMA
jgi:hypothetical protein